MKFNYVISSHIRSICYGYQNLTIIYSIKYKNVCKVKSFILNVIPIVKGIANGRSFQPQCTKLLSIISMELLT